MDFRRIGLAFSIAVGLLAIPLGAGAVATNLNVTAAAEAVPNATIEIFNVNDPGQVVEERKVTEQGSVSVDLAEGIEYGARIRGGPVLAQSFRAGESVNLSIPAAYASSGGGFGGLNLRGLGDNWTFSTGKGLGGSSQELDGSSRSGGWGASDHGDFDSVAWLSDLEVMAPPADCIPKAPRPFIHLGVLGINDDDDTLIDAPPDGGLGFKLSAELKSNWYIGVGLSYDTKFLGRDWRVKPALNYGEERIRYRGRLDETWFVPDAVFEDTKEQTYRWIGPQISLETPLADCKGWELSAFGSVGGSFILGDRETDFTVRGAGGTAHFEAEKDHGYNAFAGLRVSWTTGF